MSRAFRILERLRSGEALSEDDLRAAVAGAATPPAAGGWADAQLGAFLMGVAVRGLDGAQTALLTRAMADSGERWALAAEIPLVGDKHSTGGVGDKVTLVLGPLMAACDRPMVTLAGRGLGHTGGTIDKLESIAGLDLGLDRARALDLVRRAGLAIGEPTAEIAPADGRLYALRDGTGTVRSLPLVVASILSKKLAVGPRALVLDVKCGSGAFFQEHAAAAELARRLVATAAELDLAASALVTDMSQPLGRWAGHTVEVEEALACLEGDGPPDLRELTLALAEELTARVGASLDRGTLSAALDSGRARDRFDRWAELQGADPAWLARPRLPRAPIERVIAAPPGGEPGILVAVDTEQLGLLLAEAGGGRARPGDAIDREVALRTEARLGDRVEPGQPLARFYLRQDDPRLVTRAEACFALASPDAPYEPPPLVYERVEAGS